MTLGLEFPRVFKGYWVCFSYYKLPPQRVAESEMVADDLYDDYDDDDVMRMGMRMRMRMMGTRMRMRIRMIRMADSEIVMGGGT